jgi:hypothetical protein
VSYTRSLAALPQKAGKVRYKKGDLWQVKGYRRVVTTNIGWDPRTRRNNMGAGTVLEAMARCPDIARLYGQACKLLREAMPVVDLTGLIRINEPLGPHLSQGVLASMEARLARLIFFPVKPLLDQENPERSWAQRASLELIRRSTVELASFPGKIALTLPGCGNGGLAPESVYPILKRYLTDDRFLLVDNRDDWSPPQ